jgi:uncharacterized protein YbaR (Trm112 family)
MKPWLLNILACPFDKNHPLESYWFSWEGSEEEVEKIYIEAGNQDPHLNKQYELIAKQIEDGTISLESLKVIHDETGYEHAKKFYIKVKNSLERIKSESNKNAKDLLKKFPEDIDILYRYLNLIEVKEGLLYCKKCGRWYPIGNAVETIPELMPDNLRNEDKERSWLNKWRNKVPREIIENKPPSGF